MLRSFAFLAGLAGFATAVADERPKYVPGRYIIQLQPGTDLSAIDAHHEAVRRLARRGVSSPAPMQTRDVEARAYNARDNIFEKRADGTCGRIITVTATATATVTENAAAAPSAADATSTPGADIKECVKRTFTVGLGNGKFHAYVGNFDEDVVKEIEKMEGVISVEQDEYVYLPGSWPIAGENPYPVAEISSPSSAGHAQSTPGSGSGYASPSGTGYQGGFAYGSGSIKTPDASPHPTGSPSYGFGSAYPTGVYPAGNSTQSFYPSAIASAVSTAPQPSGTATPTQPGTHTNTPNNTSSLTTQENSPWNLADLSHKNGVSNTTGYTYIYDPSAGAGTTAYIFDTGIRLTHQEFQGRVRFGINGLTNSTTSAADGNNDGTGHGTHVAGTLAGKTYGVAKNASVVDVKVFDTGSATMSSILSGLDWAFKDVQLRGNIETAVFSMSFGARTASTTLDAAIKALYDFGILTVVAAGNENTLIGNTTPARSPEAFTVGYTNQQRNRVDSSSGVMGSNYGPELDVWAPGFDIVSASFLSDDGVKTESGTSMATPLVSGLVCYLRALEGGLGSPKAVTERVLALGEKGVVGDAKGSKNVLVYNGSGS
ncbi:subtilisin-like protein [Bimuria novae-zelandiae CBS 107.79]|uniref:Subtilisin-like protein n=1 Tax=Bimuria novae-zelandiae CBS 107.79 TaxID=1447943 RepID=A0A6A5UXZ4_9PLEO|nr:subtilisin-like protein [Bimuria novae-zelandiae CBS 107.79]